MGHALDNTLQDIIIRFKRMQGYGRLMWLPGTDHASIATEAKIVESMREEGISKEDIGRKKFLEKSLGLEETVRWTDRIPAEEDIRAHPATGTGALYYG